MATDQWVLSQITIDAELWCFLLLIWTSCWTSNQVLGEMGRLDVYMWPCLVVWNAMWWSPAPLSQPFPSRSFAHCYSVVGVWKYCTGSISTVMAKVRPVAMIGNIMISNIAKCTCIFLQRMWTALLPLYHQRLNTTAWELQLCASTRTFQMWTFESEVLF